MECLLDPRKLLAALQMLQGENDRLAFENSKLRSREWTTVQIAGPAVTHTVRKRQVKNSRTGIVKVR